MAVKTALRFLLLAACMLSLNSCTRSEKAMNNKYGQGRQKPEETARPSDVIQEDSRLALLRTYTFQEAMDVDWGFTVRIVPVATNIDTNLGVIVRQDKNWVGNYGSGFANCCVIGIEIISTSAKRFIMEIWKNEDPERPFAQRSLDTPTYWFYVDLPEYDFRAAVRRGILEKRQVVVIQLKAYDMEGKAVGEWYRQLSKGN